MALDVTANGKLRLPPYGNDSPSRINNITIFLYSYVTGRNFTITNGTESANDATLGDIMQSESGSTVKHVKWTWPQCLIGDGKPTTTDSDRGAYNVSIWILERTTHKITGHVWFTHKPRQISIRQNFRLNGEDHYTIFDVPISVTNKIEFTGGNPSCDSVNNPLLSPEEIDAESANSVGVLFAPGDSTVIQQPASTSSTGSDGGGSGIGPDKPEANPSDGLGSGASMVRWTSTARRLSVLSIVYFLFL